MKHSLHFSNYEEMSYAASRLDCYLKDVEDVEENEFEGENQNEVTFTTSSPISKAKLKAIINHFQPAGHALNQQ